jgi:quinolinate synthase
MSEIVARIAQLKREKKALILVHYYQAPEIHEIADFMGDSFDLSQKATTTDAQLIVFCGVHFMAESAAILNPGKKVVLPAFDAGCPMADTATAESVRAARLQYPGAAVVCYMNTSAEVKAESDIVCTSSNAVKIVNSLSESRVLFVPDRNLGDFTARHSKKEIILWPGHCYVHTRFLAPELRRSRELLPNAKVVVHPECSPEIRDLADHVCSTSGMITFVAQSPATEFIIGTEMGLIEFLKRRFPEKRFYAAPPGSTCFNMKKNTLDQVLEALEREAPVVTVRPEVAQKAKRALDRMLEVGK